MSVEDAPVYQRVWCPPQSMTELTRSRPKGLGVEVLQVKEAHMTRNQ